MISMYAKFASIRKLSLSSGASSVGLALWLDAALHGIMPSWDTEIES